MRIAVLHLQKKALNLLLRGAYVAAQKRGSFERLQVVIQAFERDRKLHRARQAGPWTLEEVLAREA